MTNRESSLADHIDRLIYNNHDTSLNIVQDEPLELKLHYLTKIKAAALSIVIVLVDWHAFKAQLITNAPAMLKVLASDGPPASPFA